MKNLTFLIALFAFVCFISCNDEKKKQVSGFTLNVSLNNINSTKAYLYNSKNIKVDSALIAGNIASFSGTVDSVQFYTIHFKNSEILVPILLENTQLFVYASPLSQFAYGGSIQNKLNSYNEELSLLNNKLSSVNTLDNIKAFDSINNLIFSFKIKHIKSTNHAPIANYIIKDVLSNSNLKKKNLIELKSISETLNHQQWLPKINSEIEKLEALELIAKKESEKKPIVVKRRMAPLFSGESLNGGNLSLQNALSGKKAVLIDFWASWCGPCRAVTPQVKSIYNRYKSKGFDIITISEDKTKDAWTTGITEDNMLAWNHIYDDNMRIAYMFNVESIPHMILLDGNGGIIENKISISRLENELKKIFK